MSNEGDPPGSPDPGTVVTELAMCTYTHTSMHISAHEQAINYLAHVTCSGARLIPSHTHSQASACKHPYLSLTHTEYYNIVGS